MVAAVPSNVVGTDIVNENGMVVPWVVVGVVANICDPGKRWSA